MGERYFITGVELGMLKICNKRDRSELIEKIIDKQFIGNYPTDKDKKRFEKMIKEIGE